MKQNTKTTVRRGAVIAFLALSLPSCPSPAQGGWFYKSIGAPVWDPAGGSWFLLATNLSGNSSSGVTGFIENLSAVRAGLPYAIADSGQERCYNNDGQVIDPPGEGEALSGQDAQHAGNFPAYRDNGDGTVTDQVTGLMWMQGYVEEKLSLQDALTLAETYSLGGYTDWRLPTIKELWSIFLYTGNTGFSAAGSTPFIDTSVFNFAYGNTASGERFIDAQYVSSTVYVGTTMNGNPTVFGVNFADGRIKGYPSDRKLFYVKLVRGNSSYGINDFVDNGDGTVTDRATGLMWMQADSGYFAAGSTGEGTLSWEEALAWAGSMNFAGYDDWRLPNGKELQSIVDYSRAPEATDPDRRGPAIDPVFQVSDEQSYFWTSSSHVEGGTGDYAAYVCFGQAFGYLPDSFGNYHLLDVHGAGAVRSDPKTGDPDDYPYGHGPQGDDIRIFNFARLVRDVSHQ